MIATMPTEKQRPTTGHDRTFWFAELDAWGAAGRPYREIADWLTTEQGLSAWWAQKLIVEYEEARGVRDRGARRDGTFSAGASRTVAAPADKVFEAFADATARQRWLPGVAVEVRAAQPGKVVRLDWPDGTRLQAQVEAKGPNRTTVAVEHRRLPDAARVPTMRTYWQERLEALRSLLEE
jgi:Polyketide cyclase / dehydrase and lipid transport